MMNVKLIAHTQSPELVCDTAAAVCLGKKADASCKHLCAAIESGHLSVLEHASFTFSIQGVSRVLLAQLTRHRIASFSVESQRYCTVEPGKFAKPEYGLMANAAYSRYIGLIEDGEKPEDARYILPEGTTTSLIMTMNARELLHFFALRCCSRAQWEIRELANKMLALCRNAAPIIFENAGPYCKQHGYCPETRSCGNAPRLKDLLKGDAKNEQKATPGNEE